LTKKGFYKMKFSKRQIHALGMSRNKWDNIANDGGIDGGSSNCKCCEYYRENDCKNCPIKLTVGWLFCLGTPYEKWGNHHFLFHKAGPFFCKVRCPKCKTIARAEMDFIDGILITWNLKNLNLPYRDTSKKILEERKVK